MDHDLHKSLKKYLDILKGEKPKAEPVKPAPLLCDPGSKALWADLESAAETKTCCKSVLAGFEVNASHIQFTFKKPVDGISGIDLEIRYCPACGRKLK